MKSSYIATLLLSQVRFELARQIQILVIGYSDKQCTDNAYQLAYEVGKEIASHGAVLITGGLRGVMEAASRGATEKGGLAVGIIPQEDKSFANDYCSIVIATGSGWLRDFITAYSGDAVIVIGGGAGTAIEAYAAYFKSKPIVTVAGSGGIAEQIAEKYLDERHLVKVITEKSPKAAVERALSLLQHAK